MRWLMAMLSAVMLVVMSVACNPVDDGEFPEAAIDLPGDADDDDDDDDAYVGDDDAQPDVPDLPAWLRDRPYLQDHSPWGDDFAMTKAPWPRNLGCMGVGNGRVFGILGNQYPLGSWHNLGGPTYQKDLKWFTDKEPWIVVQGHYLEPDRAQIARVADTDVVVTTADNGALEWTSVNFAPHYPDVPLAEHALVSVWIVRNLSPIPIREIYLEIDSNFGRFKGGHFAETSYDGRWLFARPIGVEAVPGDAFNDFWIPFGDLAPGQERVVVLPYIFTEEDQDWQSVFAAVAEIGVDDLLESTMRWWRDWAADMILVDTPDEKFNDLFHSLAVAIKVNQAASGGLSQMSEYSSVWLRDTHGPSLFYPLIGLAGDIKNMLDYHWAATLIRGNLANAVDADYDVSNPPAEPDWANMSTMSGRTRAEGPSTLVLEYENYFRATGDLATIAERYGMLWHALVHQQFVDGCLQYFSSDETFEDVMQVAFGENLFDEPDDESTLSLYSSLLFIKASLFMADVADRLAKPADEAMFRGMADDFVDCLEDTYWMNSRGIYAVKADAATRDPFPKPYEDVNTIPVWLGDLPLSEAHVKKNFETIMDQLGHRNGTLWSNIPFLYNAIFPHIDDSVQTGMSHGYWLGNLDRMFHPTADEAFRRWADVVTAAGFTDEAVVVDDYGHLSMLREPYGIVSDVSARFRSWESGVMGHAFLYHLTGYEPNVPDGSLRLAPHLPPEWDRVALAGLAFGNGRFGFVHRRTDTGRRLILSTDAAAAFSLELRVPVDGEVTGVSIDGHALPGNAWSAATNDYGRTVVIFDPIAVSGGATLTVDIDVTE